MPTPKETIVWTGLFVLSTVLTSCKPEAPDLHAERQPVASERAKVAKEAIAAGASAPAKISGLSAEQAKALVAKVGEAKITLGDVAAYVAQLPRSARSRYVTADQRVELLKKLVELELLASEGERQGFKQDPVVQHTYKRALAEEVLSGVGTELSLADVSDADIAAYYAENKASFVTKERRRCAVLYSNTRAEAASAHKALLEAIAQTPKAAKQIFGDFAKEKSVDPASASLKGDLGWFDAEGLNKKGQARVTGLMLKRVFNLAKVHEVSAPLQLESKQWVLVQLTGLEAAKEASMDQVRLTIQDKLLKARRVEARVAFIKELRAKADITLFSDALAALPKPPPPTGPKIPQVPKPEIPKVLKKAPTPAPTGAQAPAPAASDAPEASKSGSAKGGRKAPLNPALFRRPAAPSVTLRPGQEKNTLKLEHSGPKVPQAVKERYLGPGQHNNKETP